MKNKITLTIMLAIFAILSLVLMFMFSNLTYLFLILLIISIVLILVINIKVKPNRQNDLIQEILKECCSSEVKYYKNRSVPLEMILESNIFKRPDIYRGEDLIVDTYKGIPYYMSDLTLEKVTINYVQGREIRTTMPYFKGLFMVFDYPNDLKCDVLMVHKSNNLENIYKKIETELIEINKLYDVYTTDERYAFSILNPTILSKILELNKMNRGFISYSFTKDKLYIAFQNSFDLLDVRSNKNIEIIKNQLLLPQAIINEFNLDKGIFND